MMSSCRQSICFTVALLCLEVVSTKFQGDTKFEPFLTTDDFERAKNCDVRANPTRFYNRTDDSFRDGIAQSKSSRSFWKDTTWTNARVPYTLNSNLEPETRAQVVLSFEDYHSKTCVRFVPKQDSDTDFVDIQIDENVCGRATVCRQGGSQFVKLGSRCSDSRILIHELGHTLCMSHEFDRYDRDEYVSLGSSCSSSIVTPPFWTTFGLPYDYFSVMHYDGCWEGACIQAKQELPGKWCGNPGRLGVLDVEKINTKYNCPGCLSYRFKRMDEITSVDNLVEGGSICRMYVNGELVVGKASVGQKSCWVPYEGREVGSSGSLKFEVLTNPQNVELKWLTGSSNQPIPTGSIPGGRKTASGQYLVLPETYYIGRCNLYVDSIFRGLTYGKVHGSNGKMFVSWGAREFECNNYEILTC